MNVNKAKAKAEQRQIWLVLLRVPRDQNDKRKLRRQVARARVRVFWADVRGLRAAGRCIAFDIFRCAAAAR